MDGCVHLRVATCISASNRSYKQRVQRGLATCPSPWPLGICTTTSTTKRYYTRPHCIGFS